MLPNARSKAYASESFPQLLLPLAEALQKAVASCVTLSTFEQTLRTLLLKCRVNEPWDALVCVYPIVVACTKYGK